MNALLTPGLYRQPVEPVRPVASLSRGDIAVFVGYARRGPVSLPVRIEDRSATGHWIATSTISLARYETVTVQGLPGGPAFPTLIDIRSGDDGGSVRLALRSPNDEVESRFFDLEWLIRVLEPERTEGPCSQLAGP